MSAKWLILEWMGGGGAGGVPISQGGRSAWRIPDSVHGGVKAGPWDTQAEAEGVLEQYVQKRIDGWSEVTDPAFGEREGRISRARHRVIPVAWPDDVPVDAEL